MIINADRLKALYPWLVQGRYIGLATAIIFGALGMGKAVITPQKWLAMQLQP